MNYYLHIFLSLMHFYIKCIIYDLSVIVEWRTARCGIHVRDTQSLYPSFTFVVIYKVYFNKGLSLLIVILHLSERNKIQ